MNRILLVLVIAGLGFLLACDKNDDFITSGEVKLEVSLDTLRFDTVFTELGSATRLFKIYNRENRPVKISKIYIEKGDDTQFRLNIDGVSGNEAEEVTVWANDSIYVFGEVTVDPDQPLSVSPFIIEDRVIIENGDAQLDVHLEAWGQNANYFPSRFNKGVPVVLSCNNETITWDDEKPYVIYGEIFIDSCLLVIPGGANIYVHGGIARNEIFGVFNDGFLYTLENGSLHVLGTEEEPVIIQGDRLEEPFLDDPGQWQGIILGKGSKDNRIENATVRNAIFGIYVDSTADLRIKNTQIYNTNSSGLIGFHSRISAENCLVYNNNTTSVQLIQGGDYDFTHCTFASYGVDASALSMSNFFCYDNIFECQIRADYRLNASFVNSIIFGSRRDEIQLADLYGGTAPEQFNVSFQNCIVRVDELLDPEGLYVNFLSEQCDPCINATRDDLLFLNPNEDDYHLDSLSIAIGQAIVLPGFEKDLEGNMRDDMPDIGCYERVE